MELEIYNKKSILADAFIALIFLFIVAMIILTMCGILLVDVIFMNKLSTKNISPEHREI